MEKKHPSYTEVQYKFGTSMIDKEKVYLWDTILEQETHLKTPLEYVHRFSSHIRKWQK